MMARAGLRVALLDRRARGAAGAQWGNGVAAWMFDEARVARPIAPELMGSGHRFTILSPSGKTRLNIDDNPVLEVDMRLLGRRLVDDFLALGGTFFEEMTLESVEMGVSARPVALLTRGRDRGAWRLRARLFVDATGLAAVIRRQVPSLDGACPEPARGDICVAAQEVREIVDPHGAMAFLERHDAQRGQILAWTGRHGGYSLLNVRISPDMTHTGILTGARALPDFPSGRRILDRFLDENPWIGPRVFGGSRAIPLRRPYTRLVAPGVALLGDSASQVFSAHGSGIGVGLNAARLLAEVVTESAGRGEDPGALASLWPYARRFHRQWGGLLANSDLVRRFSQSLSVNDQESLFASGLMAPHLVRATLQQRPARPIPSDAARFARAALRAPRLVAQMTRVLTRAPMIDVVSRTYPSLTTHADVDLFRVEQRMRTLVGG